MCWALGSRAWATRRGPPWAAHLGFCRRAQTKWVTLIPCHSWCWCCFQAVEACEDVTCPALGRRAFRGKLIKSSEVCAPVGPTWSLGCSVLSQLLSPGQDDPRASGPCVPRIPSWVRQLAERSANLLSSCAPCRPPGTCSWVVHSRPCQRRHEALVELDMQAAVGGGNRQWLGDGFQSQWRPSILRWKRGLTISPPSLLHRRGRGRGQRNAHACR